METMTLTTSAKTFKVKERIILQRDVKERQSLILFFFFFFGINEVLFGGAVVKNPLADAGDEIDVGSSISGLARSLGGGNRNLLQYSCLEISWTVESGRLQSMGLQ